MDMKKRIRLAIFLLCFSLIAVAFLLKLWESGAFIFVRSAKIGSEFVIWNDKDYSYINGIYSEGRTIAKGNNDWKINAVKEDPTHTFVVVRSFLDQYLVVSDDYTVPQSGELTTVCWNGKYISDEEFLDAVAKIEAEKSTSFTYETEAIFQLTDNQHLRELYFAYENCPVATNFKGYMGKVNGKWVMTSYISQDTREPDGSPKPYEVGCYIIPDEYVEIISNYFD